MCFGRYGACKGSLAVFLDGGFDDGEGGSRSAFMERARGMCGSAQLPCFVIAVHCAVCLGNIKLPVLCVFMCRTSHGSAGPQMHDPAGANLHELQLIQLWPSLKATPAISQILVYLGCVS